MANPLTCQHNIVTTIVNVVSLEQWFVCVSCNSPTPVEWLKARGGKFGVYDYDAEERVWVYKPKGVVAVDTRSEEIFKEKDIPGPAMIVDGNDHLVVSNSKYNDGEWFIDIQDGEEQVWEVQYNMDLNEHVWVAVIHRSIWKPRGRQVERPSYQELGLRE